MQMNLNEPVPELKHLKYFESESKQEHLFARQ